MMRLPDLTRPIVSSPMAGGPTTPELVAAVCNARGLGLLAGGYRTAADLADQVARTRALTDRPFGVNVFVPTPVDRERDSATLQAYAKRLQAFSGSGWSSVAWDGSDRFDEKASLLATDPVPLVSFMFGIPGADVMQRLHAAGSALMVTVTNADEALAAERAGADALCIQGAGAGGHRGTHRVEEEPNDAGWEQLLGDIRGVTSLPAVVAGGIATPEAVARALHLGAYAVQCGTAFLLTDEAGTSAPHRAGLQDPARTETVVTRAFSGRPARALRNRFTDELGPHTPPIYPLVNQLTKPVRAAGKEAGDPERVSLWAGTGWRDIRSGSAADVVAWLCP